MIERILENWMFRTTIGGIMKTVDWLNDDVIGRRVKLVKDGLCEIEVK